MLSFSLGTYENYLSPELAGLVSVAQRTLRASYANVLMLPGGRIFFLASDGPLTADVARRLEQAGVAAGSSIAATSKECSRPTAWPTFIGRPRPTRR